MNDTRRAVLAAIADGPVSGPDLAAQLDVSRTAVWKHVEALKEAGFSIKSDDEGYELTDVPEYGGLAVEYELEAPYELEYHERIDSTNTLARERAGDGATDLVVLADEQTGGRGRLEREWAAPSGGIYASILTRPPLPPARVPLLTLAAAVAVADAAREAGVDATIKWPNDIEVDGRKLCGILTEMEGEADRVEWVVVGIGINANVDADSLPAGATSLREHVGDVDRRLFTQRVLERYHDLAGDPDAILPAWREKAVTLGQRVRVTTPDRQVVGTAIDIEPPGQLVIDTDGGVERVHAGDCEHLRPVGE